jgi:hypothetical protein
MEASRSLGIFTLFSTEGSNKLTQSTMLFKCRVTAITLVGYDPTYPLQNELPVKTVKTINFPAHNRFYAVKRKKKMP